MTHRIIKSGSDGNCALIDNKIMVDIGVSFRSIREILPPVRLILLTHTHSDHVNPKTVKAVRERYPLCRVAVPEHMLLFSAQHKMNADLIEYRTEYDYGIAKVRCDPTPHNVPNCAWHIFLPTGEKFFYATDTCDLSRVSAPGYDLYMVEANYGEQEIQDRIREKMERGEYVHEWDAMQNHLSREQADAWLAENRTTGEVVYMHQHKEEKR